MSSYSNVHVYTYTPTCTYGHTYSYVHTHTHMCTQHTHKNTQPHMQTHIHTRTHTHTSTYTHKQKGKGCKELSNGIYFPPPSHPPPLDQLRLGPMYITSGNSGAIAIARQIPEAGPSTHRSTASHCGVGTPTSHLYLSGIRHSQWCCPSLA